MAAIAERQIAILIAQLHCPGGLPLQKPIRALLTALPERERLAKTIYATTGLRVGEVLTLK